MPAKKPLPSHLDPVERLRTGQHEMAHALIGYALECTDFVIAVFKRPRKHPTRPEFKTIGGCWTRFRQPHHSIFVTCGPFACPAYAVDHDDEFEFNDMVQDFIRISGKSAASFRSCVLDPVKNLLDSAPATRIINRLAKPLAEGGVVKCPRHTDMEKFFPRDISWPLLRALCESVREAADDLPRKKK